MRGKAILSPATRGIPDLEQRIQRLKDYENKFKPLKYDFVSIVGQTDWDHYMDMLEKIFDVMRDAQQVSDGIKTTIANNVHVARPKAKTKVNQIINNQQLQNTILSMAQSKTKMIFASV